MHLRGLRPRSYNTRQRTSSQATSSCLHRSRGQREHAFTPHRRYPRQVTTSSRSRHSRIRTVNPREHQGVPATIVGKRWCGKCHFSCYLPISDCGCHCDGLGLSCDALIPFPNRIREEMRAGSLARYPLLVGMGAPEGDPGSPG